MNHKKEQAELSDLFLLGRLYYMAAGTISAEESEKTTYLKRQTRFCASLPESARQLPGIFLAGTDQRHDRP